MKKRIVVLLLLSALLPGGRSVAGEAPPRYDYFPEQPAAGELIRQDPGRTRLTDGRSGADFHTVVYGKWAGSEMPEFVVDWEFGMAARVTALKVAFAHANCDIHPAVGIPLCHPMKLELYGANRDEPFLPLPELVLDLPFEDKPLQILRIPLPGNGISVQKLRTKFTLARNQIAISEIEFESHPATSEESADSSARRRTAQLPKLKAPELLPRAVDKTIRRPSPRSMFGVCGHLMHTDFFYHTDAFNQLRYSPNWRNEFTLPWVVEGYFRTVREPVYGWWIDAAEPGGKLAKNGNTPGENRKMIESDLAAYQAADVDVLLAPFLVSPDTPEGVEHYRWLASLARRFGNVTGFEMHNEPNLKGFWDAPVEQYVDWVNKVAAILHVEAPGIPVIVGSFSGWGHAPGLGGETHVYAGATGTAAWNFAERAMQLGLLDAADGVSTHPYRTSSPPEGGNELERADDPDGFAKEIIRWWAMVQKYNRKQRPLKLYFTELGFSSSKIGYSGIGSAEKQADYLSRLMLVLFDVRLRGIPLEEIHWYDLKEDDPQVGDYEANFGLVSHSASQARPGYLAYRRIAEFFDDPADFERLELPVVWSNWPEAVKSMVWRRRSDGALIVPFWRLPQLQAHSVDFTGGAVLELPPGWEAARVRLHDLREDRPRGAGFRQRGGTLTVSPLTLTDRAAYLEILPEKSEKNSSRQSHVR